MGADRGDHGGGAVRRRHLRLRLPAQPGERRTRPTRWPRSPRPRRTRTRRPRSPVCRWCRYEGGQHIDAAGAGRLHAQPAVGRHRTTTAGPPATAWSTRTRCAARTWCTRWSTARCGSPTTRTRSPATRWTRCGRRSESQPYTLMSPYPGLDQPISLQSWGHQLKLTDADRPADRPVHRRAAAEPVHLPRARRELQRAGPAQLLPGQPAAVRAAARAGRARLGAGDLAGRRASRPTGSDAYRSGPGTRPGLARTGDGPTSPAPATGPAGSRMLRRGRRRARPAAARGGRRPAARPARLDARGAGRRLGGRRVRAGHDRAPPAGGGDGVLGARPHHRPGAAAARRRHRGHPDLARSAACRAGSSCGAPGRCRSAATWRG